MRLGIDKRGARRSATDVIVDGEDLQVHGVLGGERRVVFVGLALTVLVLAVRGLLRLIRRLGLHTPGPAVTTMRRAHPPRALARLFDARLAPLPVGVFVSVGLPLNRHVQLGLELRQPSVSNGRGNATSRRAATFMAAAVSASR